MALESFIIPIPSEVILPFGGYLASSGVLNVLGVVLAGTTGGTIGSIALYYVSAIFGNTFIKKWGKYIFISEEHIEMTSEWFKKYGSFAIFTTRLLPIVRGLISIPAGIAKMNIWPFTIYTFLGTFIWSLILTYFGFQLGLSNIGTHLVWLVTLSVAGIAVVIYILSHLAKQHPKLFGILINTSLWLVLAFFISYSLYESFFPITTTNLNYINVEKIQNKMDGKEFSFYVVGNTFENLHALENIPISKNSSENVFIMSLGNMVYSGDKTKYRILLHEIKRLDVPFLTIPGPLELKDGGYQNYYNIFGNYDYAFEVDGIRFILLNDANGKITPQQFNWLSNKISQSQTSNFSSLVVALNVPPSWARVDSNFTLDRNNSNRLKDTLEEALGFHEKLLLSIGYTTTISSSPIRYALVSKEKYFHIRVANHNLNIKIRKFRTQKTANAWMETSSVYLYSLWVLEWPLIGIIGIAILIGWFFFKHYEIIVKIRRRK